MLISVIIPTLNNEQLIGATLRQFSQQEANFEVIVVDGGSTDNTLGLVKGDVKIVPLLKGRGGALLNAGAAAARGEALLFLWPHYQLAPNALAAIEQNLTLLPQSIGGNFHLKLNDTPVAGLLLRWLKKQRYHGHYDGQGGLFIRREIFQTLGGFRPYPILADYDLARRMEAYGPTVYLPEATAAATPEFQGRTLLKTVFVWLIIRTLFRLGVHPNYLTRLLRLVSPNSPL